MKKYIITIISIIAIAIANNITFATTLDENVLPIPQWKEGFPSYILIDKNGEFVHTGHVFSLPNLLDSHR